MEDKLASPAGFGFLNYSLNAEPSVSLAPSDPGISVKKDAFWSYCGPLLLADPDSLPPSLHEWADAALSSPSPSSILPLFLPFLTFINALLASHGLHNYWLTIRATKASGEFDQPRWHTDDLFFSDSSSSPSFSSGSEDGYERGVGEGGGRLERELDLQTDWKLCATLLGPPTLFIPAPHQPAARTASLAAKRELATPHTCTAIRCPGCGATAAAVRGRLAAELAPLGSAQPREGECAVFRIGEGEGAVHSEPRMGGGDRIFVNVVPGRRGELEGLLARWGMGFPRSWWVAPGVLRRHELM
ncbi:uncharacterized protein GGS25DRAFT_530140 [Hypoxylon fragiforme]|uniref:uncharacterized protein n=1 Tax=Hypoxylon fragiforme TaxID=63214 RepID=UPI0020C5CB41|nr:uncharacterized protein GGS25DRAFT_530140 [Hypoxylon fragiforme]KAI2611327.1 hypothetical protein GGS25DRAFT_530140 [Hypoxylon fragiforme]